MEEKKSNKDLLRLENKYINGGFIDDGEGGIDHRALKIKSLFVDKEETEKKKKPFFFKMERPQSKFVEINFLVLDNLSSFLDVFGKDTNDLLADEERLKDSIIEEIEQTPLTLQNLFKK